MPAAAGFALRFTHILLNDPPADIINSVLEVAGFDEEMFILVHEAFHRMLDNLNVLMIDGSITKTLEVNLSTSWIITMDRVGHFVEIEAHQHRTESKAMIAVEMANKDPIDAGGRDVGEK